MECVLGIGNSEHTGCVLLSGVRLCFGCTILPVYGEFE